MTSCQKILFLSFDFVSISAFQDTRSAEYYTRIECGNVNVAAFAGHGGHHAFSRIAADRGGRPDVARAVCKFIYSTPTGQLKPDPFIALPRAS